MIARTLASPASAAIMHELQLREPQSAHELADATGLHVNTVRGRLAELAEQGIVIAQQPRSRQPGRPVTEYRTVSGFNQGTEAVRSRLESSERGSLLRRIVATPEAPDLARAVEQRNDLIAYLGESGFAPAPAGFAAAAVEHEVGSDDVVEVVAPIELTACPVAAQARGHEDVVCVVHLGFVRARLASEGGPLTAEALTPVDPGHSCVLSLRV